MNFIKKLCIIKGFCCSLLSAMAFSVPIINYDSMDFRNVRNRRTSSADYNEVIVTFYAPFSSHPTETQTFTLNISGGESYSRIYLDKEDVCKSGDPMYMSIDVGVNVYAVTHWFKQPYKSDGTSIYNQTFMPYGYNSNGDTYLWTTDDDSAGYVCIDGSGWNYLDLNYYDTDTSPSGTSGNSYVLFEATKLPLMNTFGAPGFSYFLNRTDEDQTLIATYSNDGSMQEIFEADKVTVGATQSVLVKWSNNTKTTYQGPTSFDISSVNKVEIYYTYAQVYAFWNALYTGNAAYSESFTYGTSYAYSEAQTETFSETITASIAEEITFGVETTKATYSESVGVSVAKTMSYATTVSYTEATTVDCLSPVEYNEANNYNTNYSYLSVYQYGVKGYMKLDTSGNPSATVYSETYMCIYGDSAYDKEPQCLYELCKDSMCQECCVTIEECEDVGV
eukprot:Pgem_evm1s19733